MAVQSSWTCSFCGTSAETRPIAQAVQLRKPNEGRNNGPAPALTAAPASGPAVRAGGGGARTGARGSHLPVCPFGGEVLADVLPRLQIREVPSDVFQQVLDIAVRYRSPKARH